MSTVAAERTLRPLRHLSWRSTAAGNIAIVVPGAVSVVVIAALERRPVIAGLVALGALLVAAVVVLPALRIRTRLDPDGITTFWTHRIGASRIRREDVRRAVVRTVYNSDGISTNTHLFLLDDAERAVLRMSDRWWMNEQLLDVAHHFGVPLETQTQPVHLAEVRRTAPNQLRWSERHRITASALVVVVTFAGCGAFAWLASLAL
jgi:hypothetical protein